MNIGDFFDIANREYLVLFWDSVIPFDLLNM